jgi:tetratricopeptide (TPR) repeat protein
MHLTACGFVLAAFLGSVPGVARAADDQARAQFERAEAAFRARRFEDARLAYQAAYELRALPGLLFNIAQCHRYLDNHERAIFFYERYLKLAGRRANRARTLELIAQERAHLKRSRAVARAGRGARGGSEQEPEPPAGATAEMEAALALEPPPATPPESVTPTPIVLTAPAPVSPLRTPAALVAASPQARDAGKARPLYRRWWFWTAAAAVVAGGVSVALLPSGDRRLPEGTLGSIDRR